MSAPETIWRATIRQMGVLLARWVREDFTLLKLDNLDDSYSRYHQSAVRTASALGDYASAASLDYLLANFEQFGHVLRVDQQPRQLNDYARIDNMLALLGPIRTKRYIGNDWDPTQAFLAARRDTGYGLSNYANDMFMAQAINTISSADGRQVLQGYGRETQPGACIFCLRLAGAARKHPVFNLSDAWEKPHPQCKCRIVPLPIYREVRVRTQQEIAQGKLMHGYIKMLKDRAVLGRDGFRLAA